MPGTTRRVGARRLVKRAGFILGGVTLLLMPVVAQNAQDTQKPRDWSRIAGNFGEVRVLPDGGPAPRTADGHPDLTGRYYPNRAGRMLQGGYRLSDAVRDLCARRYADGDHDAGHRARPDGDHPEAGRRLDLD